MKQFEKVTQSIDALAEFLSVENIEDNKGCSECDCYKECNGKETCKKAWLDFLDSEV